MLINDMMMIVVLVLVVVTMIWWYIWYDDDDNDDNNNFLCLGYFNIGIFNLQMATCLEYVNKDFYY